MKRLTQIALVIILVLVLVSGLFLAAGGSHSVAGGAVCPRVGWNTKVCKSYAALPTLAFLGENVPLPMPNVGWNT